MAKYVYDHKLTDKTVITIETLAGIKTIDVTVEDDKAVLLKVDMGAPVMTSNEQELPLWDGEQILMGEAADLAQLPVWEELTVSGA